MNDRMTLSELVACSELSAPITPRMVRFLISNRIVSEPFGRNKYAYYTRKHIDEINQYFSKKSSGYSVKQIIGNTDNYPKIYNLEHGVQVSISNSLKIEEAKILVQAFSQILEENMEK